MVATHAHQNPHAATVTLTTEARGGCCCCAAAPLPGPRFTPPPLPPHPHPYPHLPRLPPGRRVRGHPRRGPALWQLAQRCNAGTHRLDDRLLQRLGRGRSLPGHGRGERVCACVPCLCVICVCMCMACLGMAEARGEGLCVLCVRVLGGGVGWAGARAPRLDRPLTRHPPTHPLDPARDHHRLAPAAPNRWTPKAM